MYETWKEIIGFSNYKVSNLGRVTSKISGKILKPCLNKQRGYFYISVQQDGYRKNFIISRLVALHFINNYLNKPQINHIDGNKSNNKASNLEWVTPKENQEHAIKYGLRAKPIRGSKAVQSKVNENQVINIRKLAKEGIRHKDIASKYNLGVSTVTHIVNKTRWSWL